MARKLNPRSNTAITQRINRQRVLLSLYVNTPYYDFMGCATYKTLMAEAGIRLDALKTAIDELKRSGEIEYCDCSGKYGNHYLLLGHPDATSFREFNLVHFHDYQRRPWVRDWKERDGLTQAKRDRIVRAKMKAYRRAERIAAAAGL